MGRACKLSFSFPFCGFFHFFFFSLFRVCSLVASFLPRRLVVFLSSCVLLVVNRLMQIKETKVDPGWPATNVHAFLRAGVCVCPSNEEKKRNVNYVYSTCATQVGVAATPHSLCTLLNGPIFSLFLLFFFSSSLSPSPQVHLHYVFAKFLSLSHLNRSTWHRLRHSVAFLRRVEHLTLFLYFFFFLFFFFYFFKS